MMWPYRLIPRQLCMSMGGRVLARMCACALSIYLYIYLSIYIYIQRERERERERERDGKKDRHSVYILRGRSFVKTWLCKYENYNN